MFGTKHLKNIDAKSILHYGFNQYGSHTKKIEDKVKLTVSNINTDKSKSLGVEFLSGKNKKVFPDIASFHSNPLVMHFLQWDVEKMAADTRVSQHYFRNLIRDGFLQAQSEEITISFNQKPYKGYRVFFTPLKKQTSNKYQKYLGKLYEFTFINDIPGTIYSIKTQISDTKNKHPLEHTELKFTELKFLDKEK